MRLCIRCDAGRLYWEDYVMVGVIKGFSDPADELYEAVERELARLLRPPGRESQTLAYDLEALLCLAGTSVQEIDRHLGELQTVRDLLRAERERVQRELSQSSLQSTK